ncbi:hypothetical protein M1523_02395 [Patescibacteria group bacterium]|nr:hypothetical protein [Patescibacteria group bacterium]MCL5091429.1 hypothetical protein [Patescibacteria group bacterium]
MENPTVIHQFGTNNNAGKKPLLLLIAVLVLSGVAGTLVGYLFGHGSGNKPTNATSTTAVKNAAGIADKKTFKDKAEGILHTGGIDGEGNFHLERPGGVSQNVYLTSSTVDLQPYVNKKIRVWGVTFQAQKAGWLMDVGYVEVL